MSFAKKSNDHEPYFDVSELYTSSDLLQDSLKTLYDENQKKFATSSENDGYFKDGKSTELIFNICQRLSLPVEVKYVAVELFDRFMSKHIIELYEIVNTSSSKEKQLDWSSVEDRIKDQLPLRAATCIQIASKLVSHYKALTPSKVKRLLSSCGLLYGIASVVKSEMRVLRTLDFRMSATSPLTYVEILLEILRRNCTGANVHLLHEVSLKLLDLIYLQKFNIYQRLCESAASEFDIRLANDFLLLSTCVIVAASYILDADSNDMMKNVERLVAEIKQSLVITLVIHTDVVTFDL